MTQFPLMTPITDFLSSHPSSWAAPRHLGTWAPPPAPQFVIICRHCHCRQSPSEVQRPSPSSSTAQDCLNRWVKKSLARDLGISRNSTFLLLFLFFSSLLVPKERQYLIPDSRKRVWCNRQGVNCQQISLDLTPLPHPTSTAKGHLSFPVYF